MEINPTVGHGFKIMAVDEWAKRWKRNDDFPDCLACGNSNTKEHHFTQVLGSPCCTTSWSSGCVFGSNCMSG